MQTIVDRTVEAIFSNAAVSSDDLWLLADAWILGERAFYGTGISLDLLGDKLSDAALIDAQAAEPKEIDDGIRVKYALAELQRLFESGNPFLSPCFHGTYVTATDGRSALLMSSEGYEFEPYGIFQNLEHFESQVKSDGYLLTGCGQDFVDAQAVVSDEMIRNAWQS